MVSCLFKWQAITSNKTTYFFLLLRPGDAYVCFNVLGYHLFRWWLVASELMTFRNKHQWNFNQTTKMILRENASESVCITAVIIGRPQSIKGPWISWGSPFTDLTPSSGKLGKLWRRYMRRNSRARRSPEKYIVMGQNYIWHHDIH